MIKFSNESTYINFLSKGRENEFDRLFDNAVDGIKKDVLGKEFPAYAGGSEVRTNEKLHEKSPIDGTKIGDFQKCDRSITQKTISIAHGASPGWEAMGYKKRVEIFRRAADIFAERKFAVAAILSIENGKSRYESVGEVDEAIDFLRYYSYLMEKNRGFLTKNSSAASDIKIAGGFQGAPGSAEKVSIKMRPYGVFGVIAPFNFPISISTGMSTGALITGNTVIFKPSSTGNMTMLTGLKIYEIFRDAGVPRGVFNYLTGPGSEIGDELAINPGVDGVAFTGSKSVGRGMIKKSYDLGLNKVFVVETGGKDPVIVSKYADLDKAAQGVMSSAFGFCGQKCSATSRVYLHKDVKDEFMKRLLEKTRNIKIGDPLKKEIYMGPLISEEALKKYTYAAEEAKKSGKILYGGKTTHTGLGGLYVEPTIVEADHSNRLFHEELFVPFLVVDSYKKFDDAIKKANDTEYGLTAGIYSGKQSEIKKFFREIEAGVTYANREIGATTGAIVGLHSFVGWKGSGFTGKGTGSRFYLEQFMHEQSQSTTA